MWPVSFCQLSMDIKKTGSNSDAAHNRPRCVISLTDLNIYYFLKCGLPLYLPPKIN